MIRQELRIPVGTGEKLDAWLYLPEDPGPHPAVVMSHGIGGVKAAGLAPFAEHFAAHGFAAVVFDYRHWGQSTGTPRELLSVKRQLADYRSVLAFVRTHEAVDDDRIFVWGTSFAGMHIVDLAASETYLVICADQRRPQHFRRHCHRRCDDRTRTPQPNRGTMAQSRHRAIRPGHQHPSPRSTGPTCGLSTTHGRRRSRLHGPHPTRDPGGRPRPPRGALPQ